MKNKLIIGLSIILPSSCGANNSSAQPSVSQAKDESSIASGNTLVAYFSVTGHTRPLAEYAKEHLDADIFEIVPKEAYTEADIAYSTDCRANREQNDEKARPEITAKIKNLAQYSTIVLGYPIWWGQAPKILYTFVESYNLSGKTILPFCTSGSSPIGSSATNLSKSAPNATWLEGRRFAAGTSKELFCSFLDESLGK